MTRHINIPIFIPHLGCPNDCVFCNQKTISGHSDYTPEGIENEILTALDTVPEDAQVQIAFFGGSFTGINRDEMIFLLSTAKKFIDSGRVESVRLSTRPDYISTEILDILKKYRVKTVELGIQSISDNVLTASNRGHSAQDSINAMKLVKSYGFELVGQMMIGLPEATLEDEIKTAQTICECGADGARIYPTVVFEKTELCEMMLRREYTPLDIDSAVRRSTEVKKIFIKNGVECIRLGLQSSENLESGSAVAGDYHSALGELVESEIYYGIIKEYIENNSLADKICGKNILLFVPRKEVSKALGHKKSNKIKLQDEYNVKNIKVIEKDEVLRYNITLSEEI